MLVEIGRLERCSGEYLTGEVVHPSEALGGLCVLGFDAELRCVGVLLLQGAFGRAALGITSLFTYIGLGLGVLGSALALPFGLYILIVQRSPEAVLQDSVTPPSSSRQVCSSPGETFSDCFHTRSRKVVGGAAVWQCCSPWWTTAQSLQR